MVLDLESSVESPKPASFASVAWLVLRGLKYLMSTVVTCAAVAFICFGIGSGRAVLPGSPVLHFAVLGFVLVLLGYLEGLQVAILALEGRDGEGWRHSHPRAYTLHSLVTKGRNVQRFLVGRQFYVVFVVFLCSQVTTFPSVHRPEFFPEVLWFCLVETALPGALLVLAFGQLMPQLIASRYPVTFCNMVGALPVLHMTLIFESIGITDFSWLLTASVSWMAGLGKQAADARAVQAPTGAAAGGGVAGAHLLQQLASIQSSWMRVRRADTDKLELLEAGLGGATSPGDAPDTLFISAGMAQEGLQAASGDAHPEGAVTKSETEAYPTPADIVCHLAAMGQEVPRFLLPPTHSLHVPPHIVAYSLMSSISRKSTENV